MAEKVEIPIDVTGFDSLIASVEGTTRASKEMGETFRRAFAGEVLVNGINRIGTALGGVAGEATNAVGAIAQGFFAGGPVGAALAFTSASVGFLINRFQEAEAAEKKWVETRTRIWAASRNVGPAMQDQADALRRDLFDINARRERERVQAEIAADEAAARDAATRRQQQAERSLAQSDAFATAELDALLKSQKDERDADIVAFEEQQDIEAEQAFRARQAKDAEAAADRQRQQYRDAEEIRIHNLKNDAIAKATHDALEAEREERRRANEDLLQQMAAVDASWASLGASASTGFANNIGGAVEALAMMDAAQIAAATSADNLAGSLAAAGLKAIQGVLASVAQQAAVKAALYFAEGAGALAGVATAPLAPGLFAASAQFAGVAALAGGGAIAAGTAASAVAPPAAPAPVRGPTPTRTGGTDGVQAPGSVTSGGVTINIVGGRAYATGAEVGAQTAKALRDFKRYGGRS